VPRRLSASALPSSHDIPCSIASLTKLNEWVWSDAPSASRAKIRVLSPVDGFSGRLGSGPVASLEYYYTKGDGISCKTYVVGRPRNRRRRMCGKGDGAHGSVE